MAAFIQFSTKEEFARYANIYSWIAAGLGVDLGQRLVTSLRTMIEWSWEGKKLPDHHPMVSLTTAACRVVMRAMYGANEDTLPSPRTVAELYLYAEPIETPQCAVCGARSQCRAKTYLGTAARGYAVLAGRN